MSFKLRPFLALVRASMKMYYRNKGAIFFSLFLPVALMSIFGFLSKGNGGSKFTIQLTNYANTEIAAKLVAELRAVSNFNIVESGDSTGLSEVQKGHADLQVIIPRDFGVVKDGLPQSVALQTRYNQARPSGGYAANMMIERYLNNLERQLTQTPALLTLKTEAVTSNRQNFFDFILPGLLSMTIMQLGIFGVAFSFVSLKTSGALRRIQATPLRPGYFIIAQALVRVTISAATCALLVAMGTYLFDFHMNGSYLAFSLVAVLGILIFLGVGFAIAGWAKEETQVAPVANLIQLPMLLLSGIFFTRDGFPGWLKALTDYFPLTYVGHGLRSIANEGVGLAEISGDLIGMSVWLVVVYFIAVKVFRWE